MIDNFNIHGWQLKQAIKEMDEATFTGKHNDNPKLKGDQKKLDVAEPKGKITAADFAALRNKKGVKKEAATPLADLYDLVSSLVAQGVTKDEILRIVNFATAKINEGEDHEVSMAQNSLKSIMNSTSKLMSMLGNNERDIPGWIQDHITNAENYIDQAAQGFHELDNNNEED